MVKLSTPANIYTPFTPFIACSQREDAVPFLMRLLPSPTGDLVLYLSPSLDYVCCWLVSRTLLDQSKSVNPTDVSKP